MTVFIHFQPTTVYGDAFTHDGLGGGTLVRRFKPLKPSHKELTAEFGKASLSAT
jgi:hypothetical protein